MPRPRSYKSYNAIYPAVLRKMQEHYLAGKQPQPITFSSNAAAVNFRATLYAFRYALQREIVKDLENQEVKELLTLSENVSVKVKDSTVTLIDNRNIEVPEDADGLTNFLNTDLEEEGSPVDVVFDDNDDAPQSAEDLFKD